MTTPASHTLAGRQETAPTPTEISDVVFDFCGVLIDWQCAAALRGHYPDSLVDRICAADDPYGFFDYEDRMDHGEALADILPDVRNDHGDEIADIFADYIARYDDSLTRIVPGMQTLLEDLKAAGYGVWGLTNWSYETFHFAFEKFPRLEELLDGTVVSGVEKQFKPNTGFYRLAMDRFGIEPASSVFFDDTPRNVAGAQSAGMRTFVFENASRARHDLQSLGVRV